MRAFADGLLAKAPTTRIEPHLVDVNTAGVDELQVLPGVGPHLAEAIVLDRIRGGRFAGVDDLARVAGLGTARARAIGPFVRF